MLNIMILNDVISYHIILYSMLAATHAAFSTALYLGGAAVFEYRYRS